MRLSIIKAITVRSLRASFMDKGRITELTVFPISFLVIWGLFFASGVVDQRIASELLIINLIWSIANSFQTQANLALLFDCWSREFTNILRQGVRIQEMIVANIVYSTIIGLLDIVVFVTALVLLFGGGEREIVMFAELFPHYYLSSIGLAALLGGLIIKFGRSYGFLAWTGLQFIIMFSSPFSPLSSLPSWLVPIARLSPFTYIFEYVRLGDQFNYYVGLALSLLYLFIGAAVATVLYRHRRRNDGLMGV